MYTRLCWMLGLSLTLAGCRTSDSLAGSSRPEAVVDAAQFGRSYEILRDLLSSEKGYIPFEVTADGCQYRVFYMAMALAAEGIPSTAVFVFARPGGPRLHHPDGVTEWGFHVAPMIKQGDLGVETIIDPTLADETHLTFADWLARMQANETDFNISRVHGSEWWGGVASSVVRNDPLLTSFADMKPFKLREIADACSSIAGELFSQPDFGTGARSRRTKLIVETSRLVVALIQRGKIEDNYPYSFFACGASSLSEPNPRIDGNTGELLDVLQ